MGLLNKVDSTKAFRLGEVLIFSIPELVSNLQTMSDATFSNFAGPHHNYFSDWVDHVFHQKHLAQLMKKTSGKAEMASVIEDYLADHEAQRRKKEEAQFLKQQTKLKKEEKKQEETVRTLKKIEKDEKEIKNFLWKHFAWDMAKEFMYGLALGILIGFILSRMFLP